MAQVWLERRRWRVHRIQYMAEVSVVDVTHRTLEVRMVEQVEDLSAESNLGSLQMRNPGVLHDGHVRVEGSEGRRTGCAADTQFPSSTDSVRCSHPRPNRGTPMPRGKARSDAAGTVAGRG